MPLTVQQEHWLDERELQRNRKSDALARQLLEAALARAEKKKNKDKGGKGGKEDGKKANKEEKGGKKKGSASASSQAAAAAAKLEAEKPKSKYKSAAHCMATLFPNFEDDHNPESQGPMRTMQLMEVAQILDTCEDHGISSIKESVLRKALIIPQDRPEAICLENLRDEKDGLMVNPNPKELWRKFVVSKKAGKKGGKKK